MAAAIKKHVASAVASGMEDEEETSDTMAKAYIMSLFKDARMKEACSPDSKPKAKAKVSSTTSVAGDEPKVTLASILQKAKPK